MPHAVGHQGCQLLEAESRRQRFVNRIGLRPVLLQQPDHPQLAAGQRRPDILGLGHQRLKQLGGIVQPIQLDQATGLLVPRFLVELNVRRFTGQLLIEIQGLFVPRGVKQLIAAFQSAGLRRPELLLGEQFLDLRAWWCLNRKHTGLSSAQRKRIAEPIRRQRVDLDRQLASLPRAADRQAAAGHQRVMDRMPQQGQAVPVDTDHEVPILEADAGKVGGGRELWRLGVQGRRRWRDEQGELVGLLRCRAADHGQAVGTLPTGRERDGGLHGGWASDGGQQSARARLVRRRAHKAVSGWPDAENTAPEDGTQFRIRRPEMKEGFPLGLPPLKLGA